MPIEGQEAARASIPAFQQVAPFSSSFLPCRRCPLVLSRSEHVVAPSQVRPRRAVIKAVKSDEQRARKVTRNTDENGGWHPLFLKHMGTWEGQYRRVDPKTGKTTDMHRSKVEVGVRGDKYSQRNTYIWDDGREEVYAFPGRLLEGEFVIETEKISAISIVVLDDAHIFYAKFKNHSGDIVDTIRLLSPTTRARTWQVRDGNEIVDIVHVEEEKTSNDDVYFEIPRTPWS